EVDALPGKTFSGKVVRLAPAFDPTTRMLEAEVQLANPAGELRPGMYGRGSLVLAVHPHTAVVPAEAVQISDRKGYVFVVAHDRALRRPIETGVDAGEWLEVTNGLSGGEEVVIAGADGLSEGAAVRVSRQGEAPDAGVKAAN